MFADLPSEAEFSIQADDSLPDDHITNNLWDRYTVNGRHKVPYDLADDISRFFHLIIEYYLPVCVTCDSAIVAEVQQVFYPDPRSTIDVGINLISILTLI